MFKNYISDIFHSVIHKKLRTALTGFGVAWGIFILVLLLGASGGLEKGVLHLLNGFAQNSMWIYGGISTAEKGNNKYTKQVVFTSETINQLKNNYSGFIDFISPEVNVNTNIVYKETNLNARIRGVLPDYFKIKILKPEEGRLLNKGDNIRKNKVVVIGKRIKDRLFVKTPALGKELQIGNSYYKVIGVLESGTMFNQAEQNSVFVPFQTTITYLPVKNEFNVVGLTLTKTCNTNIAETHIKNYLGRHLSIDANNTDTLYIFNFSQQVESFRKIFKGLNLFLWFIGICLLLSGMVGISNIMFVIVKERTREIGIRKAVGAKRKHILWMILLESASITLMAGGIGVLLGVGTLSAVEYGIQKLAGNDFLIKEIGINWGTTAGALFILIFSGIIAGFIPAKHATEIEPIDAMRFD